MLAGLIYGLIEALVTAYLGSTYTQIVIFSVVILALAVDAERPVRPRRGQQGVTMARRRMRSAPLPIAIAVTDRAGAAARRARPTAITPFVLALVALTAIVGVGLNILLGLTGQVSLGHVGFYAIGAYTVGDPDAARA